MLTIQPAAGTPRAATSRRVGGSISRGLYPAGQIEVTPAETLSSTVFVDDLANTKLQFLLRYWDFRRDARSMPSRADIDVLDLRMCVGHLIIIDVGDEPQSL